MADEGNGGTITVGERLRRIENEIVATKSEVRNTAVSLSDRVTRHRDANQKQITELARTIVNEFDGRIKALETHDVAEEAVRSYKRWAIGIVLTIVIALIANFIAVANLLGKA